ncbi:MAG TPA: two-component sensor histidine kinase [Gammaproteobacteria bacterium]|nr:two-component sensor histidine kinase [Gammaproteobacteria bacterium]
MRQPRTLFARTGSTLTIAMMVFLLFSVAVVFHYILIPVSKRAADDLATLMMLAAQTWVELPPDTRPDFERELLEGYDLKLTLADTPLPFTENLQPYLSFLEEALTRRVGEPVPIRSGPPDTTKWFCVDIPMGGRIIRISFPHERIGARPPIASVLVAAAGTLVILLTSLLLVNRLIRPLARLSRATTQVGRGGTFSPLQETGPMELVTLTQGFNRMAGEIEQLLANRTTLFAGISHDLRTPITRMQLALEMLPADTDPTLVTSLRQDLEEMNRLISDTLDLARGLGPQEPEAIDLREFIDGIVTSQRHSGANIQWTPESCCICSVDALALQRILTNLIDNAVRYGGDSPVELRCYCNNHEAVVQVLDLGPGIPASEREQVFQPFHRLEASRSRRTGGSGLGLAIARQLCDAHGWSIQLLPREDRGTEAKLQIPLNMPVTPATADL